MYDEVPVSPTEMKLKGQGEDGRGFYILDENIRRSEISSKKKKEILFLATHNFLQHILQRKLELQKYRGKV